MLLMRRQTPIFTGTLLLIGLTFYLSSLGIWLGKKSSHHGITKNTHLHKGYKEIRTYYQLGNMDAYVFSSYLDDRYEQKFVRLYGMQKSTDYIDLKCKFYSGEMSIDVAPEKIYAISPEGDTFQAYYYGCEVPENVDLLAEDMFLLSLVVDNYGDPLETLIPVEHVTTVLVKKKSVAICVKAIWGPVDARKLVEWVEFHRLVGVEKFTFYDINVYGAAPKVLQYYADLGILDIIDFQFAEFILDKQTTKVSKEDNRETSDHEKVYNQLRDQLYLVSINDCLYRNMADFEHVAVLDINEYLVPPYNIPMPIILQKAQEMYPSASAFSFSSAWHFETFGEIRKRRIDTHIYMIKYLKMGEINDLEQRSVFDTRRFVTVNWNHLVTMAALEGVQGNIVLPWRQYGLIHHYEEDCKLDYKVCRELISTVYPAYDIAAYYKDYKDRLDKAIDVILPF